MMETGVMLCFGTFKKLSIGKYFINMLGANVVTSPSLSTLKFSKSQKTDEG